MILFQLEDDENDSEDETAWAATSHAAADKAFALGFASRLQKATSKPTSWWRISDIGEPSECAVSHRDLAASENK